ncbi:MAG: LysR family transcriptional regulator substrate-binding protein, partial [Erysipelotrichaceae bacterium]|nr:LysR family transcriptional regulator substrate-binding protein [Erysipelotrichaceae bacterium]
AIETDAMHFFGDVFLNLHNTFPGIKYNLFSGSIAEISEGILKGILDFGIVVAPLDMSQFDYLRLPMSDTFGLLMSKDNELSKKDKITPKDIKDHPVWVANQQLEGNVLSSWLKKDVSQLNIVSTFNLVTTPAMMAEQGFGMVFTFANLIDTTGNRNLCFKPLDPPIEATLYLVWKKYQLFTPAAKKFLEYVQNSL